MRIRGERATNVRLDSFNQKSDNLCSTTRDTLHTNICEKSFGMATGVKKFPLLNEIDQRINCDSLDWNRNAFETLLVRSSLTRDDTDVCFFLLG